MGIPTERIAHAPQGPHVLRATVGEVYLSIGDNDWCEGPLEAAFVFPSFRLAHRYAAAFWAQGRGTLVPVSVPSRMSSIGVVGDPLVVACIQCGCTEAFVCPGGCCWHAPGVCSACAGAADELSSWTVYAQLRDYPEGFLARQHVGIIPTEAHIKGQSLEEVRAKLPPGLARLGRSEGDARTVVEVWM